MIIRKEEFGRQRHLDISSLKANELEQVMATWIKLNDGRYLVLSVIGDNEWEYPTSLFPPSTKDSRRKIRFHTLPPVFQLVIKPLWRAYDIDQQPKGNSLIQVFKNIKSFLNYLDEMKVTSLSQINTMHCANYVNHCRQLPGSGGNPTLSSSTLFQRFLAVETLQKMTQKTDHAFAHPWPDSSASHLAGNTGKGANRKAKTLIIPDEQLKPLMQGAVAQIEQAETLFSLRDEIACLRAYLDGHDQPFQGDNILISQYVLFLINQVTTLLNKRL